jgi:hypothetical protein
MKSIRTVLIISSSIGLVGVAYVIYVMFFSPDRIDIAGKSLSDLLESGDLLPAIAVPAALIFSGFVIWRFMRTLFPPEIKNGVVAQARVLKVWDTGVSINDNPQVGLLLEVLPEGSASFQAEAKTIVSRLNVALVQPGTAAEVKYDPQNLKRIRVTTLNILPPGSSGAAARMAELEDLREKGLITREEYQQKREEILKSL